MAFQATCSRTKSAEDLTIGAIISTVDATFIKENYIVIVLACFIAMVLNYNLTHSDRILAQGTAIQSVMKLNTSTLLKMV